MVKIRVKYQLTFFHKLAFGILVALAILFICHPEAYRKDFSYGNEVKGVYFLQKGDYAVEVYYNETPSDNKIIIYSESLINENNEPGVELASAVADTSESMVRITLRLAQDTRDVLLKTTKDTADMSYINRVVVQSIQLANRDNYFLASLCLLGAFGILALGVFAPREKYVEVLLSIGLGLLASMPLLSDFILQGDDLGFHVARLEAVYQGLKAGEFPVYLGSNKMGGFGMLSATMYPDLFLYPVALLRFLGVSLMVCYKVFLVVCNIGSALTGYFAAKNLFKSSRIAFWACTFYTFSIYRLTNMYYRQALGETLAMVFLPLVIWGIYEVLWKDYRKWPLFAVAVGGVLQSHVLSTEMCAFFLLIEVIVWMISAKHNHLKERILSLFKSAGMTILVNAYFLVPFLFFFGQPLHCFHISGQLSDTGVYFSQMFSLYAAAEGEHVLPGSTTGEMPLTIGTVLLLGAILFCARACEKQNEQDNLAIGKRCLAYGILALLMASWLFPWKQIQQVEVLQGIVSSLQFAWRFLGPASALLAVTAAVGVVSYSEAAGKQRQWIYGVFAALVVCSTSYFFSMKGYVPWMYSDKMSFNDFGYADNMYLYGDGDNFHNRKWTEAYIKTYAGTDVTYSDFSRQGMRLCVTTEAAEDVDDYLLFPFYYYPGYKIWINGEPVETLNIFSCVSCMLPGGKATIEAVYVGLPAFMVANGISVLTVTGILCYGIFVFIRKKRYDRLSLPEDRKAG